MAFLVYLWSSMVWIFKGDPDDFKEPTSRGFFYVWRAWSKLQKTGGLMFMLNHVKTDSILI